MRDQIHHSLALDGCISDQRESTYIRISNAETLSDAGDVGSNEIG